MAARETSAGGQPAPDAIDDRVPVRGDTMVHEVTASDETVLFVRDRGELLLLNDMGAGIFYLIDGRRSVSEIVAVVETHFPGVPQAHEDVVRFLHGLEGAGALRFA